MVRVYYLETERIDNTDTVKGIEYIHNAILDQEDSLRKLIQDTTDTEHDGLVAVAVSWREATAEEAALLATLPLPVPPPTEPPHFSPSVQPLDLPGIARRVDSIETFLKALRP